MSGFLQKDVPVSPKQIDELEQLIRTKFDQSTGYAEVHCKSRALHQAFRKSIFGDTDWMVLDSFRSVMERLNCSHQNSPIVAALFARYDPLNTGAVGLRAFSESIFRLRPTPHCDPTHRVMIARVHEHLRAYGGDSGLRLLNVKLTQLAQLHRFGPKGVTKDQLIDALISCGVPPRDAQFVPAVFDLYNPDPETGRVEVQWFVGSVRPKPSQARLIAAKRVFGTLHKNVDGVLTLHDMTAQFQPQGHPRVAAGDLSVDNAVLEFRAAWEGWAPQAVITEAKFVEYLTDLSACVDEDAYFDALLRGVWGSGSGVDAHSTVRSVAATVRDLSGERTHLDSSIPPPITKAPGVTVRAYGAHSTARTNPRHFAGIGGPFKELKQFRDDDAQLALAAPYRGYSTTTAAMSMGHVAAVGAALQVEVTHLNGQRTIETVDASTLQQQQRAAAPEDTTESIVVRALRRGGVTDVLHARVVA